VVVSVTAERDGGTSRLPVVIIGAGLAGLAAAATLQQAGCAISLLEAGDGVGGRVRSDRTADGFLLDRGFQVLFTAYPALDGLFDVAALHLRSFDSGALVAGPTPMAIAVDPFAHPRRLPQLLLRSPFSLGDDLRVLRLKLELMGPSRRRLAQAAERSAAEELAAIGLSERARERFFRPFFGGVMLDRSLSVRAPWFLFVFKMLSEGATVVPSAGMGALAGQLAARLPAPALQVNTRATAIETGANGRAVAVRASDRRFPAAAVILAADLWAAQALYPDLPSLDPLGCTTIYFAGDAPLYRDRLIVLNPDPNGFLNEVVQITNVAPSYAPPGQHLLSCTSLCAGDLDDAAVEERSRAELCRWFGTKARGLRRLAVYRLPRSQFRQPPHWRDRRPSIRTGIPGLYLAGEYLQSSSINGALTSGVQAARTVLGEQRH
jgi:phytoene dehydrogenase-like protein